MAPRPVGVTAISGVGQRGAPGSVLPRPFVVEVRDQYDEPLAGVSVTFTVTEGGGRVGARFGSMRARTDSAGRAEALLTLGPGVRTSRGGRVRRRAGVHDGGGARRGRVGGCRGR